MTKKIPTAKKLEIRQDRAEREIQFAQKLPPERKAKVRGEMRRRLENHK
jgi:hypothetical protein